MSGNSKMGRPKGVHLTKEDLDERTDNLIWKYFASHDPVIPPFSKYAAKNEALFGLLGKNASDTQKSLRKKVNNCHSYIKQLHIDKLKKGLRKRNYATYQGIPIVKPRSGAEEEHKAAKVPEKQSCG